MKHSLFYYWLLYLKCIGLAAPKRERMQNISRHYGVPKVAQNCKKPVLKVLQNLIFFLRLSAKFTSCPPNFLSLNVQIRNTIFTACKWCKIFKYYVNNMVTSCNTCQKEEKYWSLVKYVICAVLTQFQFCHIFTHCFRQNLISRFSELTKNRLL